MIAGRSPALVLGLIVAAINVAVVVINIPWTAQQVAVLNAFAAAFVAVVANVSATGSVLGAKQD